ncbi:hypothetical protein F2Q69_00006617 [Brassica cretica]|uniref:Uncharacterized protein n=1 Tax=Brassica cretica TaxID=69181 RepID=A0A8S9PAN0_BRACR|nr:hypothetical protein F2Q69_00006617 [Brassica cretica]
MVTSVGPGALPNGDQGRLLAGTQRPVSCLGSGVIQHLSRNHTLNPGEDRFPCGRPGSSGILEMMEPGTLMISEEEDL